MENTRLKALLNEAGVLAEIINRARFEETLPKDEDTIRLCDILDILISIED
jgi:hypothetical protein